MRVSEEDGWKAYHAWRIYMFQINGTGLRCEFGGRPEREYERPWLLKDNLDTLDRWVEEFRVFVDTLEEFKDRPVSAKTWDGRDITRDANDGLHTYKCMYEAFKRYAEVARGQGQDSEDARQAMREAAYVVNPDDWRKVGAPVPEGVKWYPGLGARWYLEAVIHHSGIDTRNMR